MIRTIKLLKKGVPVALFSLAVSVVILHLCLRLAGAEGGKIKTKMDVLFSFNHNTGTYIFGKDEERGPFDKGDSKAANWWRINDDPTTGFSPTVIDATMSSEYQAVTSFELDGHPYIFGLHKGASAGDGSPETNPLLQIIDPRYGVGANIWRINDDAKGLKLVMFKGKMSLHYKHVVSFQLKGEPHILGLHFEGGVNIWRIKDEVSKGLTWNLMTKHKVQMSPNYQYLKVFYVGGHPYVIGRHRDVGTNIWRINDDAKGLQLVTKGAKMPRYDYVLPFQVKDRAYLLGILLEGGKETIVEPEKYTDQMRKKLDPIVNVRGSLVEWGRGYGCIWEVTAKSITKVGKCVPISKFYRGFTTFEQDGKVYIFGTHFHGQDFKNGYGNIWRVHNNPPDGFTMEYCGEQGGPCTPSP